MSYVADVRGVIGQLEFFSRINAWRNRNKAPQMEGDTWRMVEGPDGTLQRVGKREFMDPQNQNIHDKKMELLDSLNEQLDAYRIMQDQIRGRGATEESELRREAAVMRSRLNVAAGESGVGGSTINRLKQDVTAGLGRDIAQTRANTEAQIQQSEFQIKGTRSQAQSTWNTMADEYNPNVNRLRDAYEQRIRDAQDRFTIANLRSS